VSIKWLLPGILCAFVLSARPSWSYTRAYFSSRESLESEIVRLIDHSRTSIDIALFQFGSRPLELALERAKARRVNLRLILDTHDRATTQPAIDGVFGSSAAERRWLKGKKSRGRGVMHHKFAVFDQERVVTGSFNWTPGAEHANYENALVTDDAQAVLDYSREFDALWRRAIPKRPAGPRRSLRETSPPTRPRSRSSRKIFRKFSRPAVLQ
jgi:mitochondrial cardiolipin hydrolase